MNVTFVTFSKKENSTAQPNVAGITPVSMQLKAPCTERSPVLESASYHAENYCYIPTWNRYYFIRNKTYINGAWDYELECDYLATWKTQIGSTSMFMVRSSASNNGNLIDRMYPLLGNTYTGVIEFGDKTTFEDGYFVVGVIGNNSTSGGQMLFQMTTSQFQSFLDELFVYANGVSWGSLDDGVKLSVMNPTQYITSCRWYPSAFEVVRDALDNPITAQVKAGLWQSTTGVQIVSTGNYIARETYSLWLEDPTNYMKHNQASTLGRNMNLSPMTRYVLELGCFGTIDLDCSLLYNCTYVDIYIYADPFTGIGKARIMGRFTDNGVSYQKLLACLDGKYGVDIPLAQAGGFDAGSFTGGTIASHMGQLLNAGIVALGWKHGQESKNELLGSADSSMNGVKYATSSVGQLLVHNLDKHLYGYFQQRIVGDNTNNGRPLMSMATPSTLTGFMQVQKGIVALPCSDDEMNIVNGMLEDGFYYE